MPSDQELNQMLNEVFDYIVEKIKSDFPFKSVEVQGTPEVDEDEAWTGIVLCDKNLYGFTIPEEDPRPILQKLYPIVLEEDSSD